MHNLHNTASKAALARLLKVGPSNKIFRELLFALSKNKIMKIKENEYKYHVLEIDMEKLSNYIYSSCEELEKWRTFIKDSNYFAVT